MPRSNHFRHQAYHAAPPTALHRLLRCGPPVDPHSAAFGERLAAAGAVMAQSGVAAVVLVHGTFCGDDPVGINTELERLVPACSARIRRGSKRVLDAIVGEAGNYTAEFARRMEAGLAAGAGRPLPVARFHWSSLNHHAGRADGAVRLVVRLNELAATLLAAEPAGAPPRILIWGQSHGGNVMALATNLLGGSDEVRRAFFAAAEPFYRRSSGRVDVPAWRQAEELLAAPAAPLRRVALDLVTFGTPRRYGWDPGGCAHLLHIVAHRPVRAERPWQAAYPPRLTGLLTARDGDFVQQIGIAGSSFPPLPLAWRTFRANQRLRNLLAARVPGWLRSRLQTGSRVADDGVTLLIDYDEPTRMPWRHLFGHALYTRSRWLPLHCELVTSEFYGGPPSTDVVPFEP